MRWRQKMSYLSNKGNWKQGEQMSGTQTIVLTLAVLIFGGGSLFYFLQVNHKVASKADCRAATTTMPLVNTTTGMGMSVTVAECD